jgi:uncharacterized membrane protein YGL010W
MNSYFRRQLADYVEYHRDWWNCVMHVFGIIFLFLAAILPLNFWSVHVFGVQTTMAAMMVLPVLIYWLIGHRLFERRQPALLDNPPHLLLGPMFVMAKLFIALGFRHDLALIIDPVPQTAALGTTFYADPRNGETHPNS